MKKHTSKDTLKIKKLYSSKSLLFFAGIFVVVGIVTLLASFAAPASNGKSVEGEASTSSQNIITIQDSDASGGSYVEFGRTAGGLGCGLAGEVFCENFEEGPVAVSSRVRSGDFDSTKISAARLVGNQYEHGSGANWIERAEIPACRPGSTATPFPPDDSLICDPSSSIGTRYGLTATGSQNYGDNSYRINQQFDIAGRTGTIAFDASLHAYNFLIGFTTIAYSSEPIASPSIKTANGNGGSMKEGFFLGFGCDGGGVILYRYSNYIETEVPNELGGCNNPGMTVKIGNLNRVQVRVAQNRVEVYATDYSANGTTFGASRLIYRGNPGLSFSRGFVTFGTHNHASIKYGGSGSSYTGGVTVRSVNAVWDNIAFDGPLITPLKSYQVPDATLLENGGMATGYQIPLISGTAMNPLVFKNVQITGVTAAKLIMSAYLAPSLNNPNTFKIYYKLNGGSWHEAVVPAGQRSFNATNGNNRFNISADIDKNELINGNNTIQIAGENINQGGYAPFVANIDVLTYQNP